MRTKHMNKTVDEKEHKLKFNKNKIFVIDTNVVLHDYKAIYSFAEHNVVIPITLLEEIDNFKKGDETINYNAREFTRELDSLIGDRLLNEGVNLDNKGFLIVYTNIKKDKYLSEIFWEDKPDHRILSLAYNLSKEYGKKRVILVSKDINLRMKAKSIGVLAEDYETGKVQNIDKLYTGKDILENVSAEIIDTIIRQSSIHFSETNLNIEHYPNEYFIMRNKNKSILVTYNKEDDTLKIIEKKKAYGILPRNAEQIFSLDALMNPKIRLITLSGKAGTGKTILALAAALELEKRKEYKQILLARPTIPLSNKDIGFLPGDIESKLNPYMQPLFDNLFFIQNQFEEESEEFKKINEKLTNGKLLITPLTYIRGRSISNVFFIIDEAQNLTPHEVKTIITRAGEGTKIVFTGDPYQIDTPYLDSRSNGLTYLIDKMKGQNIYAHITLEKGERSQLAELASNVL